MKRLSSEPCKSLLGSPNLKSWLQGLNSKNEKDNYVLLISCLKTMEQTE